MRDNVSYVVGGGDSGVLHPSVFGSALECR